MIGMDFAFMEQKQRPKLMPILVVKEDSVGEVNVHALQSKAVNSTVDDRGQGVHIVR